MNKRRLLIGSVLCLVIIGFLLGGVVYHSKVWNPFIVIKGVIQIELANKKVDQISQSPSIYISRDPNDFTVYMESKGYHVDQMGRGFALQKRVKDYSL